MPELPDVMHFERYVTDRASNKPIEQVHLRDADQLLEGVSASTLRRRLKGRAMESIRRHGKYLLAEITDDGWLVMHFGMTGEPVYYEDGEAPDHTKLELAFEDGGHLAYVNIRKLGEIGLVDDPDAFVDRRDLGPDPMSEGFDRSEFRRRIGDYGGMLKTGLMDQSRLAGIGNVYSDEILFQARLPPRVTVDDLDQGDLDDLYETMRTVLWTCADHVPDLQELRGQYLVAHRMDGGDEQCPRCGTDLERIDVGGRSAQFCSSCQPE